MIRAGDISAAVRSALEAAPTWATLCPGGYWYDRGPDDPDGYPYVVAKVERGETRKTSGDAGTVRFTVRVAAYCPVGASGVDPDALEGLVLVTLADRTEPGWSLRGEMVGERVLHTVNATDGGRYDPAMRGGRDVFAAGVSVELLCQENRGTN